MGYSEGGQEERTDGKRGSDKGRPVHDEDTIWGKIATPEIGWIAGGNTLRRVKESLLNNPYPKKSPPAKRGSRSIPVGPKQSRKEGAKGRAVIGGKLSYSLEGEYTVSKYPLLAIGVF